MTPKITVTMKPQINKTLKKMKFL